MPISGRFGHEGAPCDALRLVALALLGPRMASCGSIAARVYPGSPAADRRVLRPPMGRLEGPKIEGRRGMIVMVVPARKEPTTRAAGTPCCA